MRLSYLTNPINSMCFTLFFFLWTAFCMISCFYALFLPTRYYMYYLRFYMRGIRWGERWVLRLRTKRHGINYIPDPKQQVFLVAMRHQSAWEVFKLHLWFGYPAIVLKQELLKIPLWGWFAKKLDMIPIDRDAKARAVATMIKAARKARDDHRPIVIFPEGTRTQPGARKKLKKGTWYLYHDLKIPVLPVNHNSGEFWRKGLWKKRAGQIDVQFFPLIPPGLEQEEFLQRLEHCFYGAETTMPKTPQEHRIGENSPLV